MAIMSKTTAAYMAGIVDGEGTITIIKCWNKKNQKSYFGVYLNISNTNKNLINWLKKSFGGYIYKIKVPNPKPNWNDIYRWQIYRQSNLIKILEKIKPYLKIKKRHAEIVLEFIKLFDSKFFLYERYKNGQIKKRIVDNEIEKKRDILYQELKKLNFRGKIICTLND